MGIKILDIQIKEPFEWWTFTRPLFWYPLKVCHSSHDLNYRVIVQYSGNQSCNLSVTQSLTWITDFVSTIQIKAWSPFNDQTHVHDPQYRTSPLFRSPTFAPDRLKKGSKILEKPVPNWFDFWPKITDRNWFKTLF